MISIGSDSVMGLSALTALMLTTIGCFQGMICKLNSYGRNVQNDGGRDSIFGFNWSERGIADKSGFCRGGVEVGSVTEKWSASLVCC